MQAELHLLLPDCLLCRGQQRPDVESSVVESAFLTDVVSSAASVGVLDPQPHQTSILLDRVDGLELTLVGMLLEGER